MYALNLIPKNINIIIRNIEMELASKSCRQPIKKYCMYIDIHTTNIHIINNNNII